MLRRVGEKIDDPQLLDDRAGPPVRHDHRQGVLVLRAHVKEMNVQPVDFGHELRQRVEPSFDFPPVVVGRPITRDILHRSELHTLGFVVDRLLVRPARRGDAAAKIAEFVFCDVDAERTNRTGVGGVRCCAAGGRNRARGAGRGGGEQVTTRGRPSPHG